jgi:hypothetical protein
MGKYSYYILNPDHSITGTNDVTEWSKQMDNETKIIQRDQIGEKLVSTVFLGIDHGWGWHQEPLLFETMIFPIHSWNEEYCERCSTYDQAVEMHRKAIEFLG